MKRLLRTLFALIILALACSVTYGQTFIWQGSATQFTGQFGGLGSNKWFLLPNDTLKFTNTSLRKDGQLAYKLGTVYVYDSTGGCYKALATATGAVYTAGYGLVLVSNQFSVDTSKIATQYDLTQLAIPTLQQVTDAGNTSTTPIRVGDFISAGTVANKIQALVDSTDPVLTNQNAIRGMAYIGYTGASAIRTTTAIFANSLIDGNTSDWLPHAVSHPNQAGLWAQALQNTGTTGIMPFACGVMSTGGSTGSMTVQRFALFHGTGTGTGTLDGMFGLYLADVDRGARNTWISWGGGDSFVPYPGNWGLCGISSNKNYLLGKLIIGSDTTDHSGYEFDMTGESLVKGQSVIQYGGISTIIGADNNATTLTDNTLKVARITSPHYDNEEEPVIDIVMTNSTSANTEAIGGGTTAGNAITLGALYAAANNTTLAGTEILRWSTSAVQTNVIDIYNSDLSGSYTSRTKIDKGYADATYAPISGSVNYITASSSDVLTNKSISGATNTLSAIPNNALTNSSITVASGTSGSDVNISGSPVSLGGTVTINIPTASASNRGVVSAADWTTFNSKIGGSGSTNAIPVFTASGTIGSSSGLTEVSSVFGVAERMTQTVGTLTSGQKAFAATATMPSAPSGAAVAYEYTVTGNGSAAQNNRAFNVIYSAGYTGSAKSIAGEFDQLNTSTGNDLQWTTFGTNPTGNSGLNVATIGTTTGLNVGGYYEAYDGNLNVGLFGKSTHAKNSATNIGVIGQANNTGSSPIHIGGLFTLGVTAPTYVSGALIADNGATTDPIFRAKDNGTDILTISDGGLLGTSNVEPITDNTYYIGENSATTPHAYKGVILKDTTNGNYYRIEVVNGVITATAL